MPWKVTAFFDDRNRPLIGEVVKLTFATSTTIEFVDDSGQPSIPGSSTRPSTSPDQLRNNIHAQRKFPSLDRPSVPNPDVPPPPPTDDTSEADNDGYLAYSEGISRDKNPYAPGSKEHAAWYQGWDRAEYGDAGDSDDD